MESYLNIQQIMHDNSFNVDMAIFSVKGIDLRHGMTDSNESDAQVKMALLEAGKKKILAVDSSKFDKISFTKVGEFREVDMVVTDARPSQEWLQKFDTAGVEVVYPHE